MMPATTTAIDFHPTWPESARALILRAIDRHGGWSLWSRLESIRIGRGPVSGLLFWLKGFGHTFTMPDLLTAFPKQGRVEWGGDGLARFERGDMHLPGLESPGHRRTFRGLRKLRRWRTVDALYFFGYAFASYAAVPFILPSLVFEGEVAGRWRGVPLKGMRVRYPSGAEVHCRRQSFLFDGTGLLRRNDYVADVLGTIFRAAHGLDDYRFVEGLAIAGRRTVVPRLWRWPTYWPVVLSATFDRLAVTLAKGS